ncbi:hypothetical protein Q9Q99_15930 [Curtobacterium flaccumfaciens]|nr:hypothetical protein Q9Q99_15930 [Curtobacterium flaccumfaciens]
MLAFGIVAGGVVAWYDDRPRRLAKRWRTVPPMGAVVVPGGEPRLQADVV